MKSANNNIALSIRKVGVVVLLGTLAALTTIACSTNSRRTVTSSMPANPGLHPAVLETGTHAVEQAQAVTVSQKTSSSVKPPASKLVVYKSRDYGVSFLYPWQYSFVSARAVANGDPSLRPQSDGQEGQLTLARIEIPKGFYSDTDYESGYFTLSLNQELDEQKCESTLSPVKDASVGTDNINGVEFRWIETDSGGRGQAAKLRRYVSFTNGTCYELELGVKTSNENGLAKEVNPDQVMRRLDAILRTVKILPSTESPAVPEVKTSTAAPAPIPQN